MPNINGVDVMPQYVVDEQNSLTSNKNIMTTTTKTLWKIVPNHSEIQFKVKHLVISIVTGSFGSFDGQIETDGDEFDKTRRQRITKAPKSRLIMLCFLMFSMGLFSF